MSELHDTLKTLGPVDWSEVPSDKPEPFLRHVFEAGELICNSVPNPPGGTDFNNAKVSQSKADSASSASEIVASDARSPPPHPEFAELQQSWGKPMKIAAKDNPLGISVYKMAGKDRNGAWFARRSVHEGISFTKMKRAMQREFGESLAVQGGPGEGNVRGIGGDRRLEQIKANNVGMLEVYQLSAQFPGPTTPREFITLLSTSETALTDKSTEEIEGKKRLPRHYMVVSKPVSHPEAPERNGYIRGQYESVEMIREIPIHPAPEEKDKSSSSSQDCELNPVEWIMVTRSDPGGGIPRFMVERGTPSSICGDAVKFFDWACGKAEIPDPDADKDKQDAAAAQHAPQQAPPANGTGAGPATSPQSQQAQSQPGMLTHFTNALEAGIEAYAPATVATYTHNYLHQEDEEESDTSSDESDYSFASAREAPTDHAVTPTAAAASTDTLAASMASSRDSVPAKDLSHHDKELQKLERQREKVAAKLAKRHEAELEKLNIVKNKDHTDHAKAIEKQEKEVHKVEERRQRELAKIEAKKEKELKKAEKKRQKNLDRETMHVVSRERDDFKVQVEALKRENAALRAQYEDLQHENELLITKLNQHGGVGALKAIQQEAGHKRSSSTQSARSHKSK